MPDSAQPPRMKRFLVKRREGIVEASFSRRSRVLQLVDRCLTAAPPNPIERGKTKGTTGCSTSDLGPHDGPLIELLHAIVDVSGFLDTTIIPYSQRDHSLVETNTRREKVMAGA